MSARPAARAALCALALACSTRPPEILYYRLKLPEVSEAKGRGPILTVEPFMVNASYDEERIAYRTSPYKMDYYHYHRWSASPGLLVTEFLRLAYSASGRFESVMAEITPDTTVLLRGRVIEFEEVDVSPIEWRGKATIELILLDARTESIIWHRIEERSIQLEERSPEGLAKALSKGLTSIAQQTAPKIEQLAQRALARRGSAGLSER